MNEKEGQFEGYMVEVAQCDVIKMKEMRGEVGKKNPKKILIITHFYDVTCLFLSDFLHLLLRIDNKSLNMTLGLLHFTE